MAQLRGRPDCAFVYGEFRNVGEDGSVQEESILRPVVAGDAYIAFLDKLATTPTKPPPEQPPA